MTPRFTGLSLASLGPVLAILLLAGPVLAGLAGTLLPAFGYLPALGGENLTIAPFQQLGDTPGLLRSGATSLFTGLGATLLATVAVALFLAGWSGTRGFATLRHLLSPLLAVPHAAAAFGLAFLIAPSGWLSRLFSPWATGWQAPPDLLIVNDPAGLALIAGLVAKEIPFLFLVSLSALPQAHASEARRLAAAFGYGRIAGFLCLVWQPVYRQIRLAVFAVLVFSTSVVDVAVILGPGTPETLSVRLLGWMNDADLQMRFMGSAGAMLQLGLSLLACLIWLGFERIGAALLALWCRQGWRFTADRIIRAMALLLPMLSALSIFGGLAILALWSVSGLWQFPSAIPADITLTGWMKALPRLAAPLGTTLVAGAVSAALATILAVMCLVREEETGRKGRFQWMVYLPLVVPQVAFLFGLQGLAILSGAKPGLGLLILIHVVFVLPYVFLSLSDPWRAWDKRYGAIGAGLAASPARIFWRIRLPMMAAPLLTAAAVGFAVSAGLYLPTVLIGAGRVSTITTEAVALASGGNRRVIGIYAFLQMMLPAIGFLIAIALPALLFRNRRAMRD